MIIVTFLIHILKNFLHCYVFLKSIPDEMKRIYDNLIYINIFIIPKRIKEISIKILKLSI